MELRAYIQIILKNLQLIVIFTLVALTLTVLFTTQQTPVYEASSTYVTRVNCTGFDQCIYALDTITGRQRIYVTFCDVMQSGRIREAAFAELGLDPFDIIYEDYVVECAVFPESNVMALSTQGYDPQLITDLNFAIGNLGREYNNSLFTAVELDLLDSVWFNPEPISPNYIFNAVLGLALGVTVSVTIVFLLDYLRSPAERIQEASIYEVRLNVYNNRYAGRRLTEEIERSKLQNRLLAVALIELQADDLLDEQHGDLLLRQAVMRIRDRLRPTDILAHREGSTFTLIMPETPERTALRLVRSIHENVAVKPVEVEGAIANFTAITGMIENNGGMYDGEHIIELAERALRTARRAGLNTIEFVRTKPSPFTMQDTEVEFLEFNVTDEFRAVAVEDTDIPGVMPGSKPVVGEATQPIPNDIAARFADDTDLVVGNSESVLDRIARRKANDQGKAQTAPKNNVDDETESATTRIGPFAVPKKKDPTDDEIADKLKKKLKGDTSHPEDE